MAHNVFLVLRIYYPISSETFSKCRLIIYSLLSRSVKINAQMCYSTLPRVVKVTENFEVCWFRWHSRKSFVNWRAINVLYVNFKSRSNRGAPQTRSQLYEAHTVGSVVATSWHLHWPPSKREWLSVKEIDRKGNGESERERERERERKRKRESMFYLWEGLSHPPTEPAGMRGAFWSVWWRSTQWCWSTDQ